MTPGAGGKVTKVTEEPVGWGRLLWPSAENTSCPTAFLSLLS